jgi:hypothetical protein
MKFLFDFIKLIGFIMACTFVSRYMEYFIITSHFSLYSIIGGALFQLVVIYVLYKRFVE